MRKQPLHNAKASLRQVRDKISRADDEKSVSGIHTTLVAVSKTFPVEDIRPVLQAGQDVFGENRVQEAIEKWVELKQEYPKTKLHLIGPLQSNKAAASVALFDCIETLDRPKLAKVLSSEFEKQEKTLELFIQVNTGEEQQKSGVLIDALENFINYCREEQKLEISGLMCIPPVNEYAEKHFLLLANLANRFGIAKLSMGMSADFELAIACGATHVRVGSAIFGTR